METLEQAYKSSMAALTAPVSFLEWTTLKVESPAAPDPTKTDDWSPIGLWMQYKATDYDWAPVRKIEGERYVYVFSKRAWGNDKPTLVEELRLTDDGTIYSAHLGARRFPDPRPLDGKDSPLPEKRSWNKIGKTMRFVRRWCGSRMVHYFFASRIPLSRRFVEELRKNVAFWVPATTFDDYALVVPTTSDSISDPPTIFGQWDPNAIMDTDSGTLQVPVLDPITILLHLHDLAVAATDELHEYTTIYEGQSEEKRERVVKRQQKIVLAYVVQMVLKNYDTNYGTSAHDVSKRTDQFITQYWEQVNYRVREQERWWFYLSNWYQSDPIHFLSRAHFEDPETHWLSFFLPMMLCILGANVSKPGRELLVNILKDKKRWSWVHNQVLPGLDGEESEMTETYQVPRKFALAILEVVKEMAPMVHDTATMFRVLKAHKRLHISIKIDDLHHIKDPHEAAKRYSESGKKLAVEVPEAHELVEDWKELAERGHKGSVLKITSIVELLDLTLSFKQFVDERSLQHSLTLVRSMADTSALVLEFAHGKKGQLFHSLLRLRPGIVVMAGILEGTIAVIDAVKSHGKHDQTGVAAGVLTATGATFSTLGFIGAATLGLSATPFFVIGLIVMGIGAIASFYKDQPMDTFLKHCAFGRDGGGGEIVEGLEEMKEGEYVQQLEVLLNLICNFTIERADRYRINDELAARFTMSWFTDKSYLMVEYQDTWVMGNQPGGTPFIKKRIDLASPDRTFVLRYSNAPPYDPTDGNRIYKGRFSAQLHVIFDEFEIVVPPKKRELLITGEPMSPPDNPL